MHKPKVIHNHSSNKTDHYFQGFVTINSTVMEAVMFCLWCCADPAHTADLSYNMVLVFGFNFKPFIYFYILSLGKSGVNQMCFILLQSVEVNNTRSFTSILPIWLCSMLYKSKNFNLMSVEETEIWFIRCTSYFYVVDSDLGEQTTFKLVQIIRILQQFTLVYYML